MNPHDLALRDCRLMFIRGYEVQARIGIHDFELSAAQRLIIDVDIYVPMQHSKPQADQIDEVVDYDFVRQVIQKRLGQGHIMLQETLCDDILESILSHSKVKAVQVSTRKPDVYPDCESVGVQAFRIKA